jgi:hypothetical protein
MVKPSHRFNNTFTEETLQKKTQAYVQQVPQNYPIRERENSAPLDAHSTDRDPMNHRGAGATREPSPYPTDELVRILHGPFKVKNAGFL